MKRIQAQGGQYKAITNDLYVQESIVGPTTVGYYEMGR